MPAQQLSSDGAAPVSMSIGMKLTLGLFVLMLGISAWGVFRLADILQFDRSVPLPGLLLAVALQLAKCALFFFACWGTWDRAAYGKWLGLAAVLVLGCLLIGSSAMHIYRGIMGLPQPVPAIPYANDGEKAGAMLWNITALALGPWLIWKWTGVFVRSQHARRYFTDRP